MTAPYTVPPPMLPPPRARRTGRRIMILVIVLLAILGLLIGLDRAAAAITADRIAAKLQTQGFPVEPSVTVEGFPVLTQLISRHLDGVQVAVATKNVNLQNAAPQQTILDATVGGFGINFVDQTTRFPAHFLVDYVHVYSNAAGAVAVIPDPGYGGPGDAIGSGD